MPGMLRPLLICSALLVATTSTSRAQLYGDGSCEAWRRTCAQMWGPGGPHWEQCMTQPAAIEACQFGYRRGYRGDYESGLEYRPYTSGDGSCASWRRTCAEMYGRGYKWQQCMTQPSAVRACGRW